MSESIDTTKLRNSVYVEKMRRKDDQVYIMDSDSADSEDDGHAIIDDMSDLDRRCEEIGYGNSTGLDPTPQNVDTNTTKETFDRILDKLTEVIDVHRARDQDGTEERGYRDGMPVLVNDSPGSKDSSNPGVGQQGEQVTDVPLGKQNLSAIHPRSSTPVLKVTYHQDRSTQADVTQGSTIQKLPTSQGKKSGTEALVTPGDPYPKQDTLSTIHSNEVKPCNSNQLGSSNSGGMGKSESLPSVRSNLIRKPKILDTGKDFSTFLVTFKNWARLTKIPDDQFIYTLLCYLSPELAERVTALDLTEDQLRDPSVGLPIVQKIIEGPTNYVTRRITLSKMKQGAKSITTFAEDIRKEGLKCKFANDAVKNSNLIQAFLTGLNNKECAREVLKSNPPVESFEDAVNVAVTLALATEAVNSFNSNRITDAREPIFPENDDPLYAIGQTPLGEDNHVEALQQKDAEIARL